MLIKKLIVIKVTTLLILSVFFLENCDQKDKSNKDTSIEQLKLHTEKFVEKYPSGKVKITGNLVKGIRQGKWESFYENGLKWSESNYLHGKRHGIYELFYPNGRIKIHGMYKNGEESDVWLLYLENGKFEKELDYRKK